MKRVACAILLVASVASASPTPMITAPQGWTNDPEQAASLATKVGALQHFGGAKVVIATEVDVPPTPGVALFVTRITADTLPGTREQAARAAIDDLHASAVKAYDWRVLPASADHAIVARGEWLDTSAATQTVGMVVIAASAARFVAVRGECFSADKADAAAINACVQALATLDPGIPVAERVAFEPAPEGAPVKPAEPGVKLEEPARLTDGQDVHLAPITISQTKPEADRRPVYLGAGIVVLAAVFWWNRRRRERFERDDTSEDAEDLAAAARGDKGEDREA